MTSTPEPAVSPGLCSVTLRDLSAADVLEVAAAAGLACLEWGADVHAPPGSDLAALGSLTRARGLRVASYGSYYAAGTGADFDRVLDAAVALGAPRIRVWAGERGGSVDRAAVVADLRGCVDRAASRGIVVGLEFHEGTLTDSVESTERLLEAVAGLQTYWQPPIAADTEQALAGFRRLLPRVCAVHAFSWTPHSERQPLSARRELWTSVCESLVSGAASTDVMLEFVAGDSPENVVQDASTLRDIIKEAVA